MSFSWWFETLINFVLALCALIAIGSVMSFMWRLLSSLWKTRKENRANWINAIAGAIALIIYGFMHK